MGEPLIVITKSTINEGRERDIAKWHQRIDSIVERNEPQIIAFHAFLNEDATEMTSIQVHPDAASMELHMQVLGENWDESFSDFAQLLKIQSVEYYGNPAASAVRMDRERGLAVTVHPRHLGGFTRSPSQ
jgi:hypothetical protein